MLELQININHRSGIHQGHPFMISGRKCVEPFQLSSSLPAKCVPKVNRVGEPQVCYLNKSCSSMVSSRGEYTMIIESIMVTYSV